MSETNGKFVYKNRMTHKDFYQLCHWLSMNGHRFQETLASYAEARKEASKELGREIVQAQFKEAMEVTKITWVPKVKDPADCSSGWARRQAQVQRIEAEVVQLKIKTEEMSGNLSQIVNTNVHTLSNISAELAAIRKCLVILFHELDMQPPANTICVPAKPKITTAKAM